MKTTTLLKLMATVLLIVASAVFLAACSDSDDAGSPAGDAAEHVDDATDAGGGDGLTDADADNHDADADDHDADADDHEADDHDTDADDHDADADADHDADADEHTDGDEHDPDAHAYLEAAPKDTLFLVDMAQLAFTPSVLEVKVGEVVEIAIQNSEPVLHDFTIDTVDADVHVSYLGGTGQHEHEEPSREADVHFALTEPASGIVHLKIHEPGEYTFYCSVPGHQAAGMEGTLIVTEA